MKMKLETTSFNKSLQNYDEKSLRIILVDSSTSIDRLKQIVNKSSSTKVIAFDYESRKKLLDNNIEHITCDEFLNENDLSQIQNEVYNLSKWFDQPEIKDCITYENINIGRLFHEQFVEFLVKFLKKYREIYNIYTKYSSSFFLASGISYEIIHSFTDLVEKVQGNKQETTFLFDRVRVDFKIKNHYFMIFISRNFYLKLKKLSEILINLFFGPKKRVRRKTTLLVEIHTSRYKELLLKAKDVPLNLFFYGRRRPAIWNFDTYRIFKKSNSRIITSYALIDKKFKEVVEKEVIELTDKIKKLWKNDEFFCKFFSKRGISSWQIIKPTLMQLIENRVNEVIHEIELVKNLFRKYNFNSIVVFHEVGLTEQIVVGHAKKLGIPVILLQQGLYYDTADAKLTNQTMTVYPRNADKFVVWGDITKQDAIKNANLSKSKIEVVGAPRYDDMSFEEDLSNDDYVLLAAQGPAYNYVQGHQIKNFENYEKTISKICKIVLDQNKKLVVKLHPSPREFDVTELVKKINPKIEVVTTGDIIPLIKSCSVMISMGLSTSIIEAQILHKPVIAIPVVDYNLGIPEIFKTNSCIVCYPENFESELKQLLVNDEFKQKIIQRGKDFIKKYISNHGTASVKFLEFLQTF